MMEAFNSFKNLSDSEKLKFFQVIFSDSFKTSENLDEVYQNCDSEDPSFKILLENLIKAANEKVPLTNSPEKSKNKQKTLDSWLIRRKDSSSPKTKDGSPSDQKKSDSEVSMNSADKLHEVKTLPEHEKANFVEDVISENSVSSLPLENPASNESTVTVSKPLNHDVPSENKEIASPQMNKEKKLGNEKYNLRSKRKNSELSPVAENNDQISKIARQSNMQDHSNGNDCDKVSKNVQVNPDECNLNKPSDLSDLCEKKNPVAKKKTCDPKTKRKKIQSEKNEEVSNNNEIDTQVSSSLTNCHKPKLELSLSSKSNYDAFCLISKECSKVGLNILDILHHEEIQASLNDHTLLNDDAIVFMGSLRCNSEKVLPVVHLAHSKKLLLEDLKRMQDNKKNK